MISKAADRTAGQNPLRSSFRSFGVWLVGVFFVLAGANHFITPAPYLAMMPPWLPAPALLVIVSEAYERILVRRSTHAE